MVLKLDHVQIFQKKNEKSKLFLSLEKSRQTRKVINSLKVNDKVFNNPADILQQEKLFYEKLYKYGNIDLNDMQTYLDSIENYKELNNSEASLCDGFLKYEEGKIAVNEMLDNKSPGLDCLTVEFYKSLKIKVF